MKSRLAGFFLLPAVLLWGLFLLWPLVELASLSLQKTDFITREWVGLANYRLNPDTIQAFLNSLWYILLLVPGQAGGGLIVAMLAYRLSKGWQDFARIAFYLPALAAGAISAQVWRWLFSQRGAANWFVGIFGIEPVAWFGQGETAIPVIAIILSLSALGSYVILLLAAMVNVDKSIIDAARMDGASEGRIMRSVILPTIAPQIATCATLVAIGAPQIYETVNFLAPYQHAASATFAIYTEAFRYSKHGSAAATAVVLTLVTAGATILKGRIRA